MMNFLPPTLYAFELHAEMELSILEMKIIYSQFHVNLIAWVSDLTNEYHDGH